MDSFSQLKEAMDKAHAAVTAGQRTEAMAALSNVKSILEQRLHEGSQFDGVVTMQAILWAINVEAPALALEMATVLLQDAATELERLSRIYKQQLAEGQNAEARSTLYRAYACAVTFIPKVVCPRIPWMLAAYANQGGEEAIAIHWLLKEVRPKLAAAEWATWQYPPEAAQPAEYAAAQVLIATANEIMQNPALGVLVEQSFHVAANGLALLPKGCRDQLFADGMNVLGQVYWAFGMSQYETALDCFLQCIATEEKLGNLNNAARDHMNAGAVSLSLMEFFLANSENNRAQEFRQQAESHLVAARDLFRSQNDRQGIANVLTNLGAFYTAIQDWQSAEKSFIEAWHQIDDWHGDRIYFGVRLAGNLGSLYCDMQRYDEALEYLGKAFVFLNSLKFPESDAFLLCYANLGRVLYKTGRVEEAYASLKEALRKLEELRNSFVSERTNMQLLKVFHWVYEFTIVCCVELGSHEPAKWSEGFELAERVKWRSLTILLRYLPLGILKASEEPLVAEEENLLAGEVGEALGDPDAATIASPSPRRRLEQIWDELEVRHPEYVAIRRQKTISVTESVDLLDDEVPRLVEFYLGQESDTAIAFVVQKGTPNVVAVRLPGSPREIVGLVRELKSQTEADPVRKFNEISQKLYRILFEPIAHLCEEDTGICFVPYGELHNLPFAALFDGKRYLIERNALVIAPSSSGLRWWIRKDRSASQRCLLFTATSKIRTSDGALTDLHLFRHLAQKEIAPLFAQSELNPPGKTTKKHLLEKLATDSVWDVIHIACHGIPRPNGLLSFLVMGGDSADTDKDLTAQEVMTQLHFSATLVTLSACDSAVAQTSTGDDLSGLAQAFLVSGASSVLASNTYVIQDAGVAVTRAFYESWLGTRRSKIAALQTAQRAALNKKGWFGGRVWHPQQWGAFQLYGSWR